MFASVIEFNIHELTCGIQVSSLTTIDINDCFEFGVNKFALLLVKVQKVIVEDIQLILLVAKFSHTIFFFKLKCVTLNMK